MRRKYVKILTSIAIVLIALGLIYAILVGISAAKLRRAYAALEKAGRPMRVVDVIPPQVPELENAALLYQSAAMLLKATPAPEKDILGYLADLSNRFVKESLDADERGELEQLLQQKVVTSALWAVEEGTKRSACRFNRNYEDGMGMPMLNLLDLKNLHRILGVKACVEAEAGRTNEAWRIPRAQLNFANALRAEPTLMDQLVRMGMVDFSCLTIRKLCEIPAPLQQYSDELIGLLSSHEDITPLVRALDGERLLVGEWVFAQPTGKLYRMGPMIPGEAYIVKLIQRLIYYRLWFKPLFLADHATYLHLMHENVRLLEGPYSPEKTAVLECEIEKAKSHNLVTDMILPETARIRVVHTRMMAGIRITRTGLALLQYRQTHSGFPETLDALGSENLQDPFSDRALEYRREGEGFVLYSVGTDGKDNGGTPKQPKQKTNYDIVWHFPGPSAK